jgi:hypothetical protein
LGGLTEAELPCTLTDHAEAIPAKERQWCQSVGAKEFAIRTELGMTPIQHYRRLNQLLDTEAALARTTGSRWNLPNPPAGQQTPSYAGRMKGELGLRVLQRWGVWGLDAGRRVNPTSGPG